MEFDKLSPYILRGEIYVKEDYAIIPFEFKWFEDIQNIVTPFKTVYVKITGHLHTWLIPLYNFWGCFSTNEFCIRTTKNIFYNHGINLKNLDDLHLYLNDLKNEDIELIYRNPKNGYIKVIKITQINNFYFEDFQKGVVENSNLFLIERNNKTYLIVIL